ncbi:putative Pep3/Vps18/deep orange family/Vacuolar sorting protein 39 domain 2 [Leishmania naiffi]|uniref:Pep3/Vps18/deep orange family/Vacuolar sorting protein 39 domain 2 n=1 Tax=Leishmania naiffi TaxID=5678 RepID=A0AAW3BL67_9TRYP
MAMTQAIPHDCRSHVDALPDPIAPHFELVTYPLADNLDAIEDVDCQGGVLAVLRRSGQLELRDAEEDRVLLRTLVRNPHKVFVHPQGTYVVATASDGEVTVQNTFDARLCAIAQLQVADLLGAFVEGSQEVVVGECVGWLPQDNYGAAPEDNADGFGTRVDSASQMKGSSTRGATKWSCLMGVNKGSAIFALHIGVSNSNPNRLTLRTVLAWSLPSPASAVFPIRAIEFAAMGESGCVLLISTATNLHEACSRSIATPASLFHALDSGIVKLRTQAVPLYAGSASAPEANGRVLLYRGSCATAPQSYVWNSAAGIVHGLFNRDVAADMVDENEKVLFRTLPGPETSTSSMNEEGARVNEQSFSLAKVAESHDAVGLALDRAALPPSTAPIAVVPTAFHMIVLYPRRFLVLHQPPGASWRSPADSGGVVERFAPPLPAEVAQRIRFDPFQASPPPSSELCGIIHDAEARRFFLFSRTHLWELLIEDEARQQWRFFLERGRDVQASLVVRKRYMDAARRLAFYSDTQRNLCLLHSGQFFLDCGATRHAIAQFAKCDWFEDIYALLMTYRNTNVRTAFVEARFQFLLSHLASLDDWAPQLTSIFVILVLAKLDQVARCAAAPAAEAEFNKFLLSTVEQCGGFLKEKAVYELVVRLLEEQGRRESALMFAKAMQHTSYVVAYHIAQQQFDEAVTVLGTCHGSVARLQPWYEFTSVLIQHRPVALVTALLRVLAKEARVGRVLPLQVERLMTSFARYDVSMNEVADNTEHQVVVLLDQCIHRYDCFSSAVHNYYVCLLAQTHDVVRLDDFIRTSLLFDTGYALRICLENGCTTAAVALYKHMHLYRDAVTTALYAPRERRHSSGSAEEDSYVLSELVAAEDTLRGLVGKVGKDELRHLWMLTAEQALVSHNVAAALAVVQESGGVLRTEDVLRKIDDVNLVDDFRDAICEYFDAYAEQKRQLSRTQDEVYQTAEEVKKDLQQARDQFGYITASQRCPLCHCTLLQSKTPYFVYPNCGHVVHEACAVSRLESIGGLAAFLADEGIAPHVLNGVSNTRQIAQQDCVLCGEALVVEVGIPLCTRDASWDV